MRRTDLKYWSKFGKLGSCLPSNGCSGFVFKTAWDESMRAFHKDAWAGVFAEVVHNILKELLAGQTDALSVFVETEKARVLGDVLALVIPLPESG